MYISVLGEPFFISSAIFIIFFETYSGVILSRSGISELNISLIDC